MSGRVWWGLGCHTWLCSPWEGRIVSHLSKDGEAEGAVVSVPLQVFQVEVLCNGRRHTVTKRYSEFQALHKRIKKICKVPDFPPRHVPNWMPKALEQRRQGLEVYLQGVLYHNKELPQDVLEFLKVRQCRQNAEASRGNKLLQHPHFLAELLPNTILSGVLQGLYLPLSCVPTQAAPQASAMRSSQTPTQHPGMQG
uniref:Sorting nexin 22 n=1 Tax=Ficedula albicollis TaxID=59894 RepID=A0A803WAH4_FICAL